MSRGTPSTACSGLASVHVREAQPHGSHPVVPRVGSCPTPPTVGVRNTCPAAMCVIHLGGVHVPNLAKALAEVPQTARGLALRACEGNPPLHQRQVPDRRPSPRKVGPQTTHRSRQPQRRPGRSRHFTRASRPSSIAIVSQSWIPGCSRRGPASWCGGVATVDTHGVLPLRSAPRARAVPTARTSAPHRSPLWPRCTQSWPPSGIPRGTRACFPLTSFPDLDDTRGGAAATGIAGRRLSPPASAVTAVRRVPTRPVVACPSPRRGLTLWPSGTPARTGPSAIP